MFPKRTPADVYKRQMHGGVGPHSGVGFGFGPGKLRVCQRDAGIHPHVGAADVETDVFGPEQAVERTA